MLEPLKRDVLTHAKQLLADGLARGSQGNISARDPAAQLVAVTPSAADYATMTEDDIVILDLFGAVVEGRWKPTVERDLHLGIYRARADVHAVVHCHAPYASGFAAALKPLPMVLAEAAACVGHEVPVAPFMPSGTPEFAELMVKTLADGWAAIMGQHGIVTCGPDLPRAYSTAVAVDDNARAYLLARQLGVEPTPIDAETCRLMHDQWLAHYRRAAAS